MTKKALVVNPWVVDFKLYDEWMHPLGLYYLISLLKHNGFSIEYLNLLQRNENQSKRYGTGVFKYEIIDKPPLYQSVDRHLKKYGMSHSDARQAMASMPDPDIIFVGSVMTYWIAGVEATLNLLAERFPQVPIILGGIGPSLCEEAYKNNFPKVKVFSGSLLGNIEKLQQMDPILESMTEQGFLPTLVDALSIQEKLFHAPVLTSAGCPFRCAYCASSFLYPHFTKRPLKTIIKEIRFCVENRGVVDFAFYDDSLLFQHEEHFSPLAKATLELGMPLRFHVPNGFHSCFITNTTAALMKRCGFTTIRVGYESSQEKFYHLTSKKSDATQICSAISILKNAGFSGDEIGVYVMSGLPDQKIDDVLHEIEFIHSLGVLVKPVFISPVPHTPVFDQFANRYPGIITDPLMHNDLFFISLLPGWDQDSIQSIKDRAREYNSFISNTSNIQP